jgi:hypothetical protein
MWVTSTYGKPLGWCRKNGHTWTPDKGRKPTAEEIELWRSEQIKIETARKEAAERALALLNSEKIWEQFHEKNNDYSMNILREWGFSDSWIDYLQFGLVPDYTVKTLKSDVWHEYHSPAISIPVWMAGNVVQNVKLRITNPTDKNDRFRNWYEAGRSYLYVPLHDLPLSGCGVVVCEGEKKAGIMEQTLDNLDLRCVGIQSKKPSPEVFEAIVDLEPIYLWLDPDASEKEKNGESAIEYCVRILGKERVRVIDCSVKSDDGIKAGLNPMNYIRMARAA